MCKFGTGNRKSRWCARVIARLIPSRGMKSFFHTNLSSFQRRAKRAGCGGRARSRNTYRGYVPIAVRKGRQRRDAVAVGEELLG